MEQTEQKPGRERNIFRAMMGVSVITFLSRIAGLVRDMGLVLFFAPVAWALDAFYFAFTIPNLFRRLLGEGALAASFIPEFASARASGEDTRPFASSVITLLTIFTAVVTLLGSAGCLVAAQFLDGSSKAHLTLTLTAIMLPFACFVCTAAILAAISQSLRHFSIPAAISVILNLCIIAALGVIAWQHWPEGNFPSWYQQLKAVPLQIPRGELAGLTRWVAWSVLISGALQLLVMYPALCCYGLILRPLFHFTSDRMRAVFKHMGPTTLGLGIVQINVLCDNVISYWLATREIDGQTPFEGATTYLFLGNRLMQLPLGVFAVAVATTVFPLFSTFAAKGENDKLTGSLFSALKMQLFIMLPAAATLIVLADPVTRLLYQGQSIEFTDAAVYRTSAVLVLLSAGLPFYGLQQVLTRGFYAVKDYTTPVKIAAMMAGLNFILNLICLHLPDLYRHWAGVTVDGMPPVAAWGQGTILRDVQPLALGEAGLALSTAFCAGLSVWLQWRKLRPRLGNSAGVRKTWTERSKELLVSSQMMLLGSAILGVILWWVCRSIPYAPEFLPRAERVLVPAILALIFYPVICSAVTPGLYEKFMSQLRNRSGSRDKVDF